MTGQPAPALRASGFVVGSVSGGRLRISGSELPEVCEGRLHGGERREGEERERRGRGWRWAR